MQKSILQADSDLNYESIENIGETIWILERFFIDMGNSSLAFCIHWALDPNQLYLGQTNTVEINKKNNNILINFIYSDEPDGGPFFIIPIPEFVKALIAWEKLVKEGSHIITIIEDKGILTLEGK